MCIQWLRAKLLIMLCRYYMQAGWAGFANLLQCDGIAFGKGLAIVQVSLSHWRGAAADDRVP